MANFNKVILLGNLTRDVELRYTQGGLAIAKFGMAINRRATNRDGETRESTCFVDLTAFGKQAEVLEQYVSQEKSVDEIIAAGFDPEMVQKVIQLVDFNEYKRKQAALGLKVTSRAFGVGRRMPIAARFRY